MKFSVSSQELLKKLQLANGAIGTNPVLPILEDFLFVLDNSELRISATDLETSIITTIEVRSEDAGAVAIPARILIDTLKALPPQPVTFEVDMDNFGIAITSSYGKYKLAGENGRDFPEIAQDGEETDTITVESSMLVNAISKTLFATSTDELRPVMSGVLFHIDFGKLILVATDAHKLVRYTYSGIETEVDTKFIAPKKALNLLKSALPAGEQVTLKFDSSNAFFRFGETLLVCRLIDGRYPDYEGVIPKNNPNLLGIERSDFQNSLKRISIYANKTTNQVMLDISDGSLTVSAQDLDFSNEATEQLSCSYDGDALRIGFNARFLAEMLGVLENDEVQMQLGGPMQAGILKPTETPEDEDILMLVMPVMLSN